MQREWLMLLSGAGSLLLLSIGGELVRGRRERSLIISLLRRTSTFTPVEPGLTATRDNQLSSLTTTRDQSLSSNTCSNSSIVILCRCRLRAGLSLLCRLKSTLRRILTRVIGTVTRIANTQMLCLDASLMRYNLNKFTILTKSSVGLFSNPPGKYRGGDSHKNWLY